MMFRRAADDESDGIYVFSLMAMAFLLLFWFAISAGWLQKPSPATPCNLTAMDVEMLRQSERAKTYWDIKRLKEQARAKW
jgi:hypothetical protein